MTRRALPPPNGPPSARTGRGRVARGMSGTVAATMIGSSMAEANVARGPIVPARKPDK